MTYQEAPEVTEAINELLLRWGNEPWFFDAHQVVDDAGTRLLVKVLETEYNEDLLPRRLGNCFLIVQKVRDTLPFLVNELAVA